MEDYKNLNQPATKEELKQEIKSVRKDIQDVKESLEFIIENSATKSDFKQLGGKVDALDDKFNTVMNSIDFVIGQLKSTQQEDVMKLARDDNQDEEIGNVKNRVTTIEHRIGMEPLAA